jgi:hypothetical protein
MNATLSTLIELDHSSILRTTGLPMAVADGLHRLFTKGMKPDDCQFLSDMMKENGWELRLLENDGCGCSLSQGYEDEPEIVNIEPRKITVLWL